MVHKINSHRPIQAHTGPDSYRDSSTNTFVMTLYNCGFTIEHNLCDLSAEIMELMGFPTHPLPDDLLDFYVQSLDACTDVTCRRCTDVACYVSTHGGTNRPSIEEAALQFYNILLAEKLARGKSGGDND